MRTSRRNNSKTSSSIYLKKYINSWLPQKYKQIHKAKNMYVFIYKKSYILTINFCVNELVCEWNESAKSRLELGTCENQIRFNHWIMVRSFNAKFWFSLPSILWFSWTWTTVTTSESGILKILVPRCSP